MNLESSPFRPGQPVPLEFFIGRIEEIKRLHSMVKTSIHQQRLKIGFISGERGIGKSSLANFLLHLSDEECNTTGCHVLLGSVRELNEMVGKILEQLIKESSNKPWHQQLKDFVGNKVQKVGLFGITLELNLSDDDLSLLTNNFVQGMNNLWRNLKDQSNGLLLILDDINGLATSTEFANWLKSTVDQFAVSEHKTPLCILVVGLEERRQELIENQPSLARVFELIEISPWSDEEVTEFYQQAFQSANAKIEKAEIDTLVHFTGGLPVLGHEIGEAVWRTAQSLDINKSEIHQGILNAAEIIGRKLLEPQIFSAIRSERYRSILRKMTGDLEMHFRRSELVARLTKEEVKVMDNFLHRMKKLGAIDTDPDVHGGYKFPNLLHALYFMIESQRAKGGK